MVSHLLRQLNFLDSSIDFAEALPVYVTGEVRETMKKIAFTKEEKAEIVSRIRAYFDRELDPIGALPAEFLLDFFGEKIGPYFYNRGLRDAHAAFLKKMEDFGEEIYLLEREGEKNG
jgi:uncharacterized protein (DUF2164 family)